MASIYRKRKAVRIAFDALLLAGEKMSNLCFNLSQTESAHAATFKACYKEWDAARVTYFKATKLTVAKEAR